MAIKFTWDPAKAASNWDKHAVGFEEGLSIFRDYFLLDELDSEHSTAEEVRYRAIGTSELNDVVVVWYTEWYEGDDRIIRIIGCRNATPNERRRYLDARTPRR